LIYEPSSTGGSDITHDPNVQPTLKPIPAGSVDHCFPVSTTPLFPFILTRLYVRRRPRNKATRLCLISCVIVRRKKRWRPANLSWWLARESYVVLFACVDSVCCLCVSARSWDKICGYGWFADVKYYKGLYFLILFLKNKQFI